MLNIFGSHDSMDRRTLLKAGALSLLGITMPQLLRAGEGRRGRAKSVILFNLLGGPSHIDMFDLKPEAPAEIRGEFNPIATSLTGLRICEHLPRIAWLMHKACLLRTISHAYNSHDPLPIMTGFTGANPQLQAQPSDPPDIGAICQYLGMGPRDLPGAVCLPCYPGQGESYRRGGPYGGYLGSQYDPLFAQCRPTFAREPRVNYYDPVMPIGEPLLPGLDGISEMSVDRFDGRRSLVERIDDAFAASRRSPSLTRYDGFQQRAFNLLTSARTRDAFDLSKEPARVRDRYGRNLYGSSLLVARRLVEAGVPFVSVHQEIFGRYGHAYDMHENNFSMLRDFNLPLLDQVYPALIEDLEARGLLDETLVIVMGEMGRTPRINAKAGRDHWPQCGFSLLTGGGVRPGMVYGATDRHGAYPVSNLVRPADLVATVYHLLGIDPHKTVNDRLGRPIPIAHGGEPVLGVLS